MAIEIKRLATYRDDDGDLLVVDKIACQNGLFLSLEIGDQLAVHLNVSQMLDLGDVINNLIKNSPLGSAKA